MLGTIVNTLAVLAGGTIGILIKGGLSERFRTTVMQAVAMAVIFVGISGALSNLLQEDAEAILFIISLAIGAFIGEWLNIEKRLEQLGDFLQSKLAKNGGGSFTQGFVASSLLFCVGTMAVLGAIESGIHGVHNTLYAKSVIDGVTAIMFASTMGIGVAVSSIVVFVYQGAITLAASQVEVYMTADMLREIGIVGGILITGLGFNLLEITKIKVGNLLPAILVPVIYYLPFVQNLFGK